MCGIAGIVDLQSPPDRANVVLHQMLGAIVHRGPDDAGIWHSDGVSLGHRRLSILDLSPNGHQPMVSQSGRYVLCLNGEIYNHADLRNSLVSQGIRFRGHSDTEVLLELIDRRGLEDALQSCVGMFALAVWDKQSRSLQLARDRIGEKPLYYGWYRGCFLFGSELKALVAHPAFVKEVDVNSLGLLCRFGYIAAPYSIYKATYKLPAGHILTLALPPRTTTSLEGNRHTIRQYWSVNAAALNGIRTPFLGSYDEAKAQLEGLLEDSVKHQMHADVPLGAFLSGGIDSSTVAALMQRHAGKPIRTFCIGFELDKFNEAQHARAVAHHLGTQHTEQYIDGKQALDVIPSLPEVFDEPLADPSQIPTILLARVAKRDVTVSLSGDGADELFGGYDKYRLGRSIDRIPFRRVLGKVIEILPGPVVRALVGVSPSISGRKLSVGRIATLVALLNAKDQNRVTELTSTIWRGEGALVLGCRRIATSFDEQRDLELVSSYERLAMLLDRETYLPNDILAKVDRATMAVGLESRAPFLDHRVVEFVSRLPIEFLTTARTSKRILRDILYKHVPKNLVDRPKSGFSVPLADWLRGALRPWAEDLLSEDVLRKDGYLNVELCRSMLRSHVDGIANHSRILWTILTFQSWRQRWL